MSSLSLEEWMLELESSKRDSMTKAEGTPILVHEACSEQQEKVSPEPTVSAKGERAYVIRASVTALGIDGINLSVLSDDLDDEFR